MNTIKSEENIALNKHTGQSADVGTNYAVAAVSGNKHLCAVGKVAGNSADIWWYVDLGEEQLIEAVSITSMQYGPDGKYLY